MAGQGARADELLAAARKLPALDRIVLRASPTLPASHPAQEKIKATTDAAAFVCVGETCSLPVTEPGAIADAMVATRR